jgi:luciferase family oxidoreductase group 1
MKNKELKIGLLEFGLSDRQNSLQALEDIFTYATKADELGYSRFWISEHHRQNSIQSYNNPEILISLIAGMTENIRVGSAGSLIGYYSPYSLVQNYKLLNNIYNNRIDFGLSKGRPENSHLHNFFNLKDQSYENKMYLKNLEGICDLLHNEEKNYEEKKIVIPPFKGDIPSLWYLSNSYKWKDLAIEKGLNICRSLMHGLDVMEYSEDREGLLEYKEKFYLENNKKPEIATAIAISFSESKEEIEEKESKKTNRREALKVIAVSENTFNQTLLDLQYRYNIDEFIIYDTEKNIDKKIENLNLIKELTTYATCKIF